MLLRVITPQERLPGIGKPNCVVKISYKTSQLNVVGLTRFDKAPKKNFFFQNALSTGNTNIIISRDSHERPPVFVGVGGARRGRQKSPKPKKEQFKPGTEVEVGWKQPREGRERGRDPALRPAPPRCAVLPLPWRL